MWKDSYKIGDELVDAQHKGLFETTERLLHIIESGNAEEKKQECINTIIFLKGYAVQHFADEEALQESLDYCDIDAHKAIHKSFVSKVLDLEIELTETDFSVAALKKFTGFLTTWLIYHVAGADQKIKTNEKLSDEKTGATIFYLDCFAKSANEVLRVIAGIITDDISYVTYSGTDEDIRIKVHMSGENQGEAVFVFTKEIAFNLIRIMTEMEVTVVDEFVISALSEMANIISGKATTIISDSGKASDIDPPKAISSFEDEDDYTGFSIDTELGDMAVSINISEGAS